MERTPVVSSNLAAVGYDPVACVLEVEFKQPTGGGTVYRYRGVPAEVYRDMLQAGSKGAYLHRVIKPLYAVEKVG